MACVAGLRGRVTLGTLQTAPWLDDWTGSDARSVSVNCDTYQRMYQFMTQGMGITQEACEHGSHCPPQHLQPRCAILQPPPGARDLPARPACPGVGHPGPPNDRQDRQVVGDVPAEEGGETAVERDWQRRAFRSQVGCNPANHEPPEADVDWEQCNLDPPVLRPHAIDSRRVAEHAQSHEDRPYVPACPVKVRWGRPGTCSRLTSQPIVAGRCPRPRDHEHQAEEEQETTADHLRTVRPPRSAPRHRPG